MPEGSVEREVLIRLVYEVDKRSGEALRRAGKDVEEVQEKAEQAGKRVVSEVDKAIRTQATAIQRTQKEYEKAQAKVEVANRTMLLGFQRAAGGAMALTRAVMMLGATGEKDTQKLLRQLIKIQMLFDGMRGAYAMIEGMTRMWKGYEAAVKASAVAHTALAAAQVASGATGAVAGAGAGGRIIGAGGAAVGAGVGAKVAAGGIAGVGGATIGLAIAAVASAITAQTVILASLKDAIKYGPMGGGTPGGLLERIAIATMGVAKGGLRRLPGRGLIPTWTVQGALFAEIEQEERIEGTMAGLQRGREAERRREAYEAIQTRQQTAVEQARRRSEAVLWGLTPRTQAAFTGRREMMEGRLGGATDQRAALEDLIQARREELAFFQQSSRQKLATHQQEIESLRTEARERRTLAQQIKQAGISAAERFGAMGVMERGQAARAFEAVMAGTATRRQEQIAEQFGGPQAREKIRQARLERGRETWQRTYGPGWAAAAEEQRGLARDLQVRIRQDRRIQVTLEHDDIRLAEQIREQLEPLLMEQSENMRRIAQREADRALRQQAVQGAAIMGK